MYEYIHQELQENGFRYKALLEKALKSLALFCYMLLAIFYQNVLPAGEAVQTSIYCQ